MATTHAHSSAWFPGQIFTGEGLHEPSLLKSRVRIKIMVTNTGDRPVQVGSHFHFFEVNRELDFDREQAYGMRLLIPAGTAIRFEPGLTSEVELIAYAGERYVIGFNGLVEGRLDDEQVKKRALAEAKKQGFKGVK